VRIQHHGRLAVLLAGPQRRLSHLVVRDRDTHNRVGIEHLVDIGRQDRVHEAHLPLDPLVVGDVTQLDHVPLVGLRRYPGGVDIGKGREDLLDRALVLPADVGYRHDRVADIQQSRQRNRRVQRTSVLLEPLTGVRHDLVAGDRAQHGHLATRPVEAVRRSRHLLPFYGARTRATTLEWLEACLDDLSSCG